MKDFYPILFITACINPNGMLQTAIQDVDERYIQYKQALDFYLQKTPYDIVFCENTGVDISKGYEDFIRTGRFEVLTFNGNDYDKSLGKGYGECLIVEYALRHSQKLKMARKSQPIVKISGRHIVKNIKTIINVTSYFVGKKSFVCAHINKHSKGAVSDLYFATLDFHQMFIEERDKIDERKGMWYEHVLYSTMRRYEKGNVGKVLNLPVPLVQQGFSGSTGLPFQRPSTKDYISSILKCVLYNYSIIKIE